MFSNIIHNSPYVSNVYFQVKLNNPALLQCLTYQPRLDLRLRVLVLIKKYPYTRTVLISSASRNTYLMLAGNRLIQYATSLETEVKNSHLGLAVSLNLCFVTFLNTQCENCIRWLQLFIHDPHEVSYFLYTKCIVQII